MTRIKLLGLATMALVVMAVSVSSAFGASEFKSAGGFPVEITKGEGGAAKFESTGGEKIECKKSKTKAGAKIENALSASGQVEYETECKASGPKLTANCTSPIVTKVLKFEPGDELGEPNLGKEKAGLLIKPKEGKVLAEPVCGGITIKVEGALVCESPEAGTGAKTTAKVVCVQTSAGVQKFTAIKVGTRTRETGLKLKAVGLFGITEEEAQTTTETLTFSKAIEQSL